MKMRRIIREDEPVKPSERISTLAVASLSTISEQRKVDPRKLSHSIRGELDWIVMKALEKEPCTTLRIRECLCPGHPPIPQRRTRAGVSAGGKLSIEKICQTSSRQSVLGTGWHCHAVRMRSCTRLQFLHGIGKN